MSSTVSPSSHDKYYHYHFLTTPSSMWDCSSLKRKRLNPGALQWKHSLNHWTAREVPINTVFMQYLKKIKTNAKKITDEQIPAF